MKESTKQSLKKKSEKSSTDARDYIVFVDWDGTLCFDRFWKTIRNEQSSDAKLGREIDEVLFKKNKRYVKQWMKGKYTSEDINRFLSKELGVSYRFLWNTFVSDCKDMKMNEKAKKHLASIKNRAYTCLITGNMDSFNRFTLPNQDIGQYFDMVVNSYDSKRLKTEYRGAEFNRVAKFYNIPLDKSFLIDDSSKSCEVINMRGGTSFRVSTPADTIKYLTRIRKSLV